MSLDRYSGFGEFVQARGRALSRTAFLLTGDHSAAEDLLQTALIKTARHWPRVRTGNPDAYVRRALVNQQISSWRRRRLTESPSAELPDRPQPGDEAEASVTRLALIAALRQLPPRQRAVVVLRFYEDMSAAETADALGVSIGTVKSQTHAALARMRSVMPALAEEVLGR